MGTPIKSAAPLIDGLTDEEVADAFALRLLDADGPNVGRRVWAALEQIPVLKARLAALEADARRYQEKADAIHKYLTEKNNTALLAVITELSLDAQKRAALPQEPGGK